MTPAPYCLSRTAGRPKERFPSERAARRALARKRKFRGRRWPHVYACPSCGGFHLTASVEGKA